MATMSKFDVLTTLGPETRTAAAAAVTTYSGAAVDLSTYVNPGGRQLKAILSVGSITSTGTLNVRIQESTTSAEAGFSNITGATFVATASSASLTGSETIHFRTNNRYVRAMTELSNTGQNQHAVYIVAERKLV